MSDDQIGLRDYLDAKFEGIDIRFDDQDRRLTKIENAGPKAGWFGGIGTMIGAAIAVFISAVFPKSQ